MRAQSAISAAVTTITRTVTVAAGVFAPGHLGELTRIVPFELVDAVLAETGRTERRLRRLPSRVGLYFVLALAFPLPALAQRTPVQRPFARLRATLPERPAAAVAHTFVVTDPGDVGDANPSDTLCYPCTLRAAIENSGLLM